MNMCLSPTMRAHQPRLPPQRPPRLPQPPPCQCGQMCWPGPLEAFPPQMLQCPNLVMRLSQLIMPSTTALPWTPRGAATPCHSSTTTEECAAHPTQKPYGLAVSDWCCPWFVQGSKSQHLRSCRWILVRIGALRIAWTLPREPTLVPGCFLHRRCRARAQFFTAPAEREH